MTDVSELRLPGVGVRYEFRSHTGARIAVLAHRSGRREIFRGDPDDPDAFQEPTPFGPICPAISSV